MSIINNLNFYPPYGGRSWKVTTEPTIDPVTLDELKEFARIEYSTEDAMLRQFIKSSTRAVESYLGKALISQTIKLYLDYWLSTEITFPVDPVVSVTQVVTLDQDDTETVYSSDNYYLNNHGSVAKLVIKNGVTLPTNTERYNSGFMIEYIAGYGSNPTDVPSIIKDAILLWAAVAQSTRVIDPENIPPEVKNLLKPYKSARVRFR